MRCQTLTDIKTTNLFCNYQFTQINIQTTDEFHCMMTSFLRSKQKKKTNRFHLQAKIDSQISTHRISSERVQRTFKLLLLLLVSFAGNFEANVLNVRFRSILYIFYRLTK